MKISKKLKDKADCLFWIFEETLFQDKGNYPRRTNLVLEFAEFVSHSTQEDLEKYISFSSEEEFLLFKKMINNGVDMWLDAGTLKTLFLD